MFEGNVLVKKYRVGGQEDYLTTGFALFGIYQSAFFLFLLLLFKIKVVLLIETVSLSVG